MLINVNFFNKIRDFLKKNASIHIASDSKSYISDILLSIIGLKKGSTFSLRSPGKKPNFSPASEDGKSKDLAYLVNKVSEIENLSRIRYMTSHPIDMTDSLIKVHKTNQKLMPFLHLPIQSGSDKILKDMNRKHTVDSYKKIVDKLREERPDIALSSDFIVGYPNETDKDFEDTMKFVDDVEFVIAYSFMYSQRPGTPAQKKDNVPVADKKARLSALQSLLKEQQKKFNKSFVGSTMEILFEKKGRYQDQYIGRSIYNQSVFTKNNKNLINTIEKVKILNSTDFALESLI